MEGRHLVRAATVGDFLHNPRLFQQVQPETPSATSLYPAYEYKGYAWSMAVDLNLCTGCNACVLACSCENNVPVVGKQEVLRGRQMHWIRIDRYFEGTPDDPQIYAQPVMCMHCESAPCEVVCPVAATVHSSEGLSEMIYNRCVGSRYCVNNCPYKVRRFNFFDYTSFIKDPARLVFNPEVTVRPRGVMEKCTFCIQRIQDVRQRANVEGRSIRDGEIMPACAVACPAEAIVFGDLNDSQSKVSKMSRMDRGYKMLTELGVKPSVTYLMDISNPVTRKGKA